jgi:hypothetical protein
VFLLYASPIGAAFLDRALYLPEEWTSDRVRRREAGIPDEVEFATKGALAQQMLQRAFDAGVAASWVVGDTVYGYEALRLWLEEQGRPYVLAVTGTHTVWAAGQQQSVALLAALLPPEAWVVLSAGEGSQGPRLYAWAWLQVPPAPQHRRGLTRWVLIRRSLTDPRKKAYYRVAGPATTTLAELVQVAGSRWRIEEGFEQAKGEVGLDHYEVRGWSAWYRYVTLALLAHAVLVVLRAQWNPSGGKRTRSRWSALERRGTPPADARVGRARAGAGTAPVVVPLPPRASSPSSTLSSRSSGDASSLRVRPASPAHPVARSPAAHGCVLGAAAPPASSPKATHRPTGNRSSPGRRRDALDSTHRLLVARATRAVWALVYCSQSLSTLVERGLVAAHRPNLTGGE